MYQYLQNTKVLSMKVKTKIQGIILDPMEYLKKWSPVALRKGLRLTALKILFWGRDFFEHWKS